MPLFSRFPPFSVMEAHHFTCGGEAVLKKLWAWVKDDPLNHFLIILIFIGGAVMLGIVVSLIGEVIYESWVKGYSIADSDALRNLIFAIGGVGAAIGLWFAKVRQEKFSDQVDTQIEQVKIQFDQSFNDRLGRGVELLANEKVIMRQAGLRVLDDLIKNTDDQNQKHIIANLIHDFVRDKARIRYQKDKNKNVTVKKIEKTEDRQDIELAIKILMQIHLDDQVTLPFTTSGWLNLTDLDFSHINFSRMTFKKVNFVRVIFKNVDFTNSHFVESSFKRSFFEKVVFYQAKLEKINFKGSHMKNTDFYSADLSEADFSGIAIRDGRFVDTKIQRSEVSNTRMIRCSFSRGAISIGDTSPDLIGCRFDSHARFDYSEDLLVKNTIDFSRCCFPISRRPTIFLNDKQLDETDGIEIDETRGYVMEYGIDVFIESDKDWSRQPVKEWMDVEFAEWDLDIKKRAYRAYGDSNGSSENLVDLEKDLEAKRKALTEAKAEFDRREAKAKRPANPD